MGPCFRNYWGGHTLCFHYVEADRLDGWRESVGMPDPIGVFRLQIAAAQIQIPSATGGRILCVTVASCSVSVSTFWRIPLSAGKDGADRGKKRWLCGSPGHLR